ncbi:hypothetical protein MKX03_001244, partial [Papaver bracteatum]
ILAFSIVEELAVDQLLSGKVITPNIYDANTRTERVVAFLNGVLSSSSITKEH